MKVPVYNQQGKEIDTILLPKEIFEIPINFDLLYQVVVSQMANQRRVIAHTKNRGEVSGGGKKPWRQKGTGRARHGSIRSPLWRGGGVTFGPRKEKVYKKEIPKKMKRKALFMVLSEKARNNLLIVLEELKIDKPKTKIMVDILKKFSRQGSILIVLPNYDKNLILSARNIAGVSIIEVRNLNVLDLLNTKYLLLTKDSIKTIEKTFIKN